MHLIKRLLSLALVWACLLSSPAFAGFTQVSGTGTGGAVFNTVFGGGTTATAATTVALNIGDIVALIPQDANTGTRNYSCASADGLGNTWQAATGSKDDNNGAGDEIWYSKLTVAIPSGTNLTCSTNSAGFLLTAVAARPAGTGAFDGTGPGPGGGAGTSVTAGPTPTLACPSGAANCEFCVAGATWHAAGTTASDATYTTVGGTGAGNPWTDAIKFASATTALSYTATNTSSANYAATLVCFKDTPAGGVTPKPIVMRSIP